MCEWFCEWFWIGFDFGLVSVSVCYTALESACEWSKTTRKFQKSSKVMDCLLKITCEWFASGFFACEWFREWFCEWFFCETFAFASGFDDSEKFASGFASGCEWFREWF
jgi:hypothetical protein